MKLSELFSRMIIVCFVSALIALLPATSLIAAEQPARPETAPQAVMEQRALDLLKRVSVTLGGARAFTYRCRSLIEVVGKTGQLITVYRTAEVALQRPNKVREHVRGESNFDLYYDGRNITAFAPEYNVYSVTTAPDTIDAMLPFVEKETGIHFPLAYIMFSDPYSMMMAKGLISAFVAGTASVDGLACEHLAFMAPGVNWEVWIDTGTNPLPRLLAVTYTDVQNLPRYLYQFSDWNLQPSLDDRSFVFERPPSAKEVAFRPRGGRNAQ